ncbi:hypothetical protein [Cerasicoccus maritimus]|uniref:hypothetical protein n=1 Tax=Cerasicoccus maritimus TaxID=490089 RepID=UPI002852732A|nr:hypothetical protein [Cerasicoccus maritimus]
MEKQTLEPKLHIRFTNDFTAVQVEGDIEDSSSFSVTLMTAIRSLSSGAEALSLGEIKSLRGIDCGQGFQLTLDESGHNLKQYHGVVSWADLGVSSSAQGTSFPVLPAEGDLTGWIDQLNGVRWRGLRSQADDQWQHYLRSDDESAVSQFALAVLQLDLLVRSLSLPRRQLQIQFADSVLWMAVNDDSDFLLVLCDASLPGPSSVTLERCLSFFCWPL